MTIRLYNKVALLIIALCGLLQTPILSMESETEEVICVPRKDTPQSNEFNSTKEFVDQRLNDFFAQAQECNKVFDFGQEKKSEFFYLNPDIALSEKFSYQIKDIIEHHSLLVSPTGHLVKILLSYAHYQHLTNVQMEKLETFFGSAYINFTNVKNQIEYQLFNESDSDGREYKRDLIQSIDALNQRLLFVETVFREIQSRFIFEFSYHPETLTPISFEQQALSIMRSCYVK